MRIFFKTFDDLTGNVEKQPYPLIRDCYICTTNFVPNPRYFIYSRTGSVNKLYSRKFLTENHIWFQDIPCAEDRTFYFQVLMCAEKIAIINEYLMHYRINNNSFLVGCPSTPCKQECNFRSYEKIRDMIQHVPPEVQSMIIDMSVQNFFGFYHNAEIGSEEIMKRQLINYILWMDLSILEDIKEYPWHGEFCTLLHTAAGFSRIATLNRQTDLFPLKISFWRCSILSQITFGKTREIQTEEVGFSQ